MNSKPEEVQKILSVNVKNQRNKLKLSQERLAKMADLSIQTINDIEGCRKWVSARTISKLSTALNVECFQLLVPDFSTESRKETTPTQNFMKLKEKMHKGVDALIDSQFTDFIKAVPRIDNLNRLVVYLQFHLIFSFSAPPRLLCFLSRGLPSSIAHCSLLIC